MKFTATPNPKGEREYSLRKRFENEWKSLPETERRSFVGKAFSDCRLDATRQHGPFVAELIETYAWTLFAETCDPVEAKAIANAGWSTMADVEAGAVPVGGW